MVARLIAERVGDSHTVLITQGIRGILPLFRHCTAGEVFNTGDNFKFRIDPIFRHPY